MEGFRIDLKTFLGLAIPNQYSKSVRKQISICTVVLYMGSWRLGDFGPKLSSQNQLDICFLTAWEHWLGIAKPKNVFTSTLNHCIKLLWNFKNFLFNRFFYWLTDWLMPSDKRNSIMAIATGLISSLFNVASSRDVPFCQPQQLQCSYHGFTKNYLCSPLCSFPFSFSMKVTICGTHVMASVWN